MDVIVFKGLMSPNLVYWGDEMLLQEVTVALQFTWR